MTSAYDVVYPAKGRVTFDGGLNNKFERSIIRDNESPDCYNVVFTNGAVATVGGSTKLNTTAIGSFAFDGLYTRRANTGAETMVAFAGGTAWQLAGATFTTIPSAQSVFTAGVRVGTTQYENHMFIGNGFVTPYKYNGTAFTRHGVPEPSTAPTGTVSASGGTFPSAVYYYKVGFVNSAAAEGDVSTMSTAFSVAVNGSVELTGIPVAPTSHGVNSRTLYRASGTAGVFQRIATIGDNTTTTFSDTYFPAGATAPTDNGEPPVYSVACYHQNRLWVNDAANPNYVWYSNLFEPYTFASTNFIAIGDASFDLVKGLSVYDNAIAVMCENGMYLIYMPSTTPTDWSVVKTRSQVGGKSPFSTFLYNNKLAFGSMQNSKFVGFSALTGSAIDPEATTLDIAVAGSEFTSDRIEPDMFQVQEAYVGNISAMVFQNKAYISLTSGNGNTANNRVYVFDFSYSNLSKDQEASWVPISGINAAQFCVYDGKLYYGSSTANGFVYQLLTDTYAFDGTAINSYFWTKEFSGQPGHETLEKDFRWLWLLVDKAGAYYMNLTARVDSDQGAGVTKQLDLNPGSTIWNAFTWGVAEWGGGSAQEEIKVPLGPLRGKRLQLKFSNQNALNQRFKVHGMRFTYNIKGKR